MLCTSKTHKGQPCGMQAIKGGAVCKMHGGSLPNVKAAARLRLAGLIDPAIGVMADAINGEHPQFRNRPDLRIVAAKDILDRNGFKPTDKIEVDQTTMVMDAERLSELSDDEVVKLLEISKKLRKREIEDQQDLEGI